MGGAAGKIPAITLGRRGKVLMTDVPKNVRRREHLENKIELLETLTHDTRNYNSGIKLRMH